MLAINCAVVTTGRVICVNVAANATQMQLQSAIKDTAGLTCAPSALELFVTKRKEWTKPSATDVLQLKTRRIPDGLDEFTDPKHIMSDLARLSSYGFPAETDDSDNRYALHVLVTDPTTHKPRWKPEPDIKYSITYGNLYFVNREATVEHHSESDDPSHGPLGWDGQDNLLSALFVNKPSLSGAMNEAVAHAIKKKLTNADDLSILAAPYPASSSIYMQDLVDRVGPLFTVLEDIHMGLSKDPVVAQTAFEDLCRQVLVLWTQVVGLFFVVTGKTSIFKSSRNEFSEEPWLRMRGYSINRVKLSPLRPDDINMILTNTLVGDSTKNTLATRWELKSSDDLELAVTRLFEWTLGHPQDLRAALQQHKTFSDFLDYGNEYSSNVADWSELYQKVWSWRSVLVQWIPYLDISDSNDTIDLSNVKVEDEKVSGVDVIAQCHLKWEGTLEKARCYRWEIPASSFYRAVRVIGQYIRGGSGDSDNTQSQLGFPQVVEYFPQITKSEKLWRPSVRAESAHPAAWPMLLAEMVSILGESAHQSVCFKARPRSLSSSVLLVTRRTNSEAARLVTVGLVVNAIAMQSDRDMECKQFDVMFDRRIHENTHVGPMINVLIVCATSSGENIKAKEVYRVVEPPISCKYVNHVIMLDVSSPERRAVFFDIDYQPKCIGSVEAIVSISQQ